MKGKQAKDKNWKKEGLAMTTNLKRFNNIHQYLRKSSSHIEWKKKSYNASNGRCVVTKRRDELEIHHLNKSFSEIVEEAHRELGLEEQETDKYTQQELFALEIKVRELHSRYGLGVAVHKNIHALFHKKYGKKTTKEDFYQFKRDLKSKKYKYKNTKERND